MRKYLCEFTVIALSLALLACSKPNQPVPAKNSASNEPTPTRVAPLASGKSQNWDVAILNAVRSHRENDSINPMATKVEPYDWIELDMEVEYLGPTGKVPAPNVFIDNSSRRVKIEHANMEYEGKGNISNLDDAQAEFDLLAWLQNLKNPPPRSVVTGAKFRFSYGFTDPKADNLKLVFADVPPVPLPKPKEQEPGK